MPSTWSTGTGAESVDSRSAGGELLSFGPQAKDAVERILETRAFLRIIAGHRRGIKGRGREFGTVISARIIWCLRVVGRCGY